MKRILRIALAAAGAAALFAGLVHAVLVVAHVSEPAATTVQGLTPRRLWATAAVFMGLAGVAAGGSAARSKAGIENTAGRFGGNVALGAGLIAFVSGGLNVAVAKGGPGTGNGVVGGAAAFVLGLIALALGGRALARSRRSPLQSGRTT